MRENINLISFNNKIPLSFSIISFDNIYLHVHRTSELIINLDGDCEIEVEGVKYVAKPYDMIIINPMHFHSLKALNKVSTILSILIDQEGFLLEEGEAENLTFNLNTMSGKVNPRYNDIRYLVFSIVIYNTKENINSIYTNRAIAYSLFAQLMNDFSSKGEGKIKDNLDALTKITSYIYEHYKDCLSLLDLSKIFNYSDSYISRLFKETLNKTFLDYYSQVRVSNSLNDLLLTNKTIEEVSINNGFENSRSYVRAFLKIYGCYPSEYKKDKNLSSEIFNISTSKLKQLALDKIITYYNDYSSKRNVSSEQSVRNSETHININAKSNIDKLPSYFKNNILTIPNGKMILNQNILKGLDIILKETKYKYMIIKDLFTFSLEDNSFNDLYYVMNLTSYLKEKELTPIFLFKYNTKENNPEEFLRYIYSIFDLFRGNIDHDIIKNYYFGLDIKLNGEEKLENYFFMYRTFYIMYSKIFKIASINLLKEDLTPSAIYDKYFYYCKSNNVEPDLYLVQYAYDTNKRYLEKETNVIVKLKQTILHNPFINPRKLIIYDINFTPSQCLSNDSIFAASYLAKVYLDFYKLEVFGISKASILDSFDTHAYSKIIFYGGSGLLTYNNIKKASYNSHIFISKLGDSVIKKGEGFIITRRSENQIVILLNNYAHYSSLYAENDYYKISLTERYGCFSSSSIIKYYFHIANLNYPNVRVKVSSISKKESSSFDKWVELGAIENLSQEDIEQLKNLSSISSYSKMETCKDHYLLIEEDISPLEVKLIELFGC